MFHYRRFLHVFGLLLIDRLLKRGQASGRSDDNIDTIKSRLEVYNNQTNPLKEFYIKEKLYAGIKGEGSIDGIFADIKKAIALLD